jgi:hypothetical protein
MRGPMAAPRVMRGAGSPEGVITANVGVTYQQNDGATGETFWVKNSGTGNTGWQKITPTT